MRRGKRSFAGRQHRAADGAPLGGGRFVRATAYRAASFTQATSNPTASPKSRRRRYSAGGSASTSNVATASWPRNASAKAATASASIGFVESLLALSHPGTACSRPYPRRGGVCDRDDRWSGSIEKANHANMPCGHENLPASPQGMLPRLRKNRSGDVRWKPSGRGAVAPLPSCAGDTRGVSVVRACPRLGVGWGAANLAQRRARVPLHRQVPERHNAHRLPPFNHRQAANGVGAHEPHRLLDAVRGRHGD